MRILAAALTILISLALTVVPVRAQVNETLFSQPTDPAYAMVSMLIKPMFILGGLNNADIHAFYDK